MKKKQAQALKKLQEVKDAIAELEQKRLALELECSVDEEAVCKEIKKDPRFKALQKKLIAYQKPKTFNVKVTLNASMELFEFPYDYVSDLMDDNPDFIAFSEKKLEELEELNKKTDELDCEYGGQDWVGDLLWDEAL